MGPEQRTADLNPGLFGASEAYEYFGSAIASRAQKQMDLNVDERSSRVRPSDSESLGVASADVYARASNLLREAMGADGVIFVNGNKASSLRSGSGGGESDFATRRSETEGSDSALEGSVMAEVLAFSTRGTSSIGGYPVGSYQLDLTERSFQQLLRRHPQGIIHHIDENGEISLSSDEWTTGTSSNDDNKATIPRRVTKDGKVFSRITKDARTIAFYPLWDDSLERWRSCVFAWGTSAERCKPLLCTTGRLQLLIWDDLQTSIAARI